MTEYVKLEGFPVTTRWWALVIRGLAAIAFGVLAFANPSISLFALVILWGAYAIVDGVFAVVVAIRGARVVPGWGWLLAEGIVSIASGVVTYLWPGITAVALLAMIAVWAVLTGVAEIVTASAPASGRMARITPNAIDRTPVAASIHSPCSWRRSRIAVAISATPVSTAHTAIIASSTTAVIPGQR